jgi:Effector Associated Constant Component 1
MEYKVRIDVVVFADIDGEVAEAELRALYTWLTEETPRPGRVRFAQEPEPGVMGAGLEVLEVALGAGGALSVLAGAISTWIKTRRRPVRLRVRRPDGEELEISAEVRNPDLLIEEFLAHAASDD